MKSVLVSRPPSGSGGGSVSWLVIMSCGLTGSGRCLNRSGSGLGGGVGLPCLAMRLELLRVDRGRVAASAGRAHLVNVVARGHDLTVSDPEYEDDEPTSPESAGRKESLPWISDQVHSIFIARPWARPASADGLRVVGSSGLAPNAVWDASFGVMIATLVPCARNSSTAWLSGFSVGNRSASPSGAITRSWVAPV